MAETLPVYFPLGVAEPSGQTGFMADPRQGILAIDLQVGQIAWAVGSATRPLIAFGSRLAAMQPDDQHANGLRVVVLDTTRSGTPMLVSQVVLLADWVAVATASEDALSIEARVQDDVSLIVRWRARARYGGGAPPPDFVLQQASRDAAGTISVDLTSGAVSAGPPGPDVPDLASFAITRGTPVQVWSLAGRPLALVMEVADGLQRLRLQTAGGQTLDLLQGTALVAHVTPDGMYVFVHQDQLAGGQWWVFSAETGERVGTLTRVQGAQQPRVIGNQVYYLVEGPIGSGEQALSLAARELTADRLQWELALPSRLVSTAPPLRS